MPLNLSRWQTISNATGSTELETYKINAVPLGHVLIAECDFLLLLDLRETEWEISL